MLPELISTVVLGVMAAATVYFLHRQRQQRLARERLLPEAYGEVDDRATLSARTVLGRMRWLPWTAGILCGLVLHFAVGLSWVYCLAIALLVSLLGGQLEGMLVERRIQKMETQLADAIDLMVGALRAGAGVLNSLDNAALETRTPLRQQLEEVVGRIRLGDDAQEVFRELTTRVPLETFMLFSSALSVHWEVGGSLAPTLATVGRTIRDRIELTRRIRAMTAQSRMSTIGVLIATYAIAAIMWANDPSRMEDFLASDFGSIIVAGIVVLQAVGIVWSAALARIDF
jgi:tight adherence protein B